MILKNLLFSSTAYSLRILTNLIAVFLIARFLTKYDFGVFSYYFAITMLLAVIFDFGYNIQLVKRIANSKNDSLLYQKNIENAFQLKNFISLAICLITCFYCLAAYYYAKTPLQNLITLGFLLLSVCFYSYSGILLYILQGSEKFKAMANLSVIGNLIVFLTLIAALLIAPSLITISGSLALGRLISFIIQYQLVRKTIQFSPVNHLKIESKSAFFEWKINTSYFLVSFFALAYIQIDAILIKHFMGYESVAIYQAGMRLAFGCMMLADMVSSVFLPRLSPLFNSGQHDTLKNELRLCSIILSSFGFIAFIIAALVPNFLTNLLYGHKYAELASYFPLFFFIVFMRYFGSSASLAIAVIGANYLRTSILVVATLLNITLNIILIPRFGLLGAINAAILTLVFLNGSYFTCLIIKRKIVPFNLSTIILLLIALAIYVIVQPGFLSKPLFF